MGSEEYKESTRIRIEGEKRAPLPGILIPGIKSLGSSNSLGLRKRAYLRTSQRRERGDDLRAAVRRPVVSQPTTSAAAAFVRPEGPVRSDRGITAVKRRCAVPFVSSVCFMAARPGDAPMLDATSLLWQLDEELLSSSS